MTKKMFNGVHQGRVDVDTACKLMGYAGSGGGAASSALGALRQFGLVDGLRGDVAVSELAMKIIQPLDESERIAALHEAASKPEIFGRILNQFGGRLPASDEPIRAYLIRNEGFSTAGANELIKTLRDTMTTLPEIRPPLPQSRAEEGSETDEADTEPETVSSHRASPLPRAADEGELITFPLGSNARAELRLIGTISAKSYERLIRHLELLKETAAEED
jgi:hypothetical protein